MKVQILIIALVSVIAASSPAPTHALTGEAETEFRAIMHLTLTELGQSAESLIEERFPGVDWEHYRFPAYVFNNQETEMAYKVAVTKSELLGVVSVSDEDHVIPCYCTCDSFGHKNLLYCFYKNGEPNEGFDEHGAQCPVCIRQALLAFLWDDLGANHQEIMAGMKEKFAPLIEKYHQHQHE